MSDVGIIADSHGCPETIAAALTILEGKGCRRIFHLGDICDSSHPETADACIELVRAHRVSAILGRPVGKLGPVACRACPYEAVGWRWF